MQELKRSVRLFFCGLLMGAADIVPGVSGGTIAFILGIYEEFLESIKSFNTQTLGYFLQLKYKKFFTEVKWKFLLCLLSGIVLSLLFFAKIIDDVLNHELYRSWLYSGFFGLILASIVYCIKLLKGCSSKDVVALVIGAIIAFALTQTNAKKSKEDKTLYDVPIQPSYLTHANIGNVDKEHFLLLGISGDQVVAMVSKKFITPNTLVFDRAYKEYRQAGQIEHYKAQSSVDIWLIICGIIAVSAMLLPGISGSYLLQILGVYGLVISALADLGEGLKHLTMEKEALWVLTNILFGILIGALVFSRVVTYFLTTYRQMTLAALIGFMIGALRSVWPFWSYTYFLHPLKLENGPLLQPLNPVIPSTSDPTLPIAIAISLGCFISVYLLERWANKQALKAS
jgi:putative membrane protein